MAVTEADVLHIAALARLRVEPAELPTLVAQLNSILGHMTVLASVDTSDVTGAAGVGADGTPLRADDVAPVPLACALESIAPEMRDGFFIVPRIATHGDPSEEGA